MNWKIIIWEMKELTVSGQILCKHVWIIIDSFVIVYKIRKR